MDELHWISLSYKKILTLKSVNDHILLQYTKYNFTNPLYGGET